MKRSIVNPKGEVIADVYAESPEELDKRVRLYEGAERLLVLAGLSVEYLENFKPKDPLGKRLIEFLWSAIGKAGSGR